MVVITEKTTQGARHGMARRVQARGTMRSSLRPRIVNAAPMRVSLAALGAFGLIALMDEPSELDLAIYAVAERLHDRRLELLQRPLEIIGLPGVYIPVALLGARSLRRRGRRGGPAIVNAAWGGWLVLRLTRLLIHRPRPPRPRGRGPKRESTFPSGHTTGLTALALVAAKVLADEKMLTPPRAWALGFGVPLAIGLNRVYVREHWLTDVLGGWALGATVALTIIGVRRIRPSVAPGATVVEMT
jgi:membrane-associated phospholipid phosphatase